MSTTHRFSPLSRPKRISNPILDWNLYLVLQHLKPEIATLQKRKHFKRLWLNNCHRLKVIEFLEVVKNPVKM